MLIGFRMTFSAGLRTVAAMALIGLLAACDNAEDRAEGHYQSALELLEAGDIDRAVVEFRNVFKLNGEHRDARATYANMRRQQGDYQEAIGQYLRLVEQYPEDLEGNIALAEMLAEIGRWDEMQRFTRTLAEIEPDAPLTRALGIIELYNQAVTGRDPIAAESAAALAVELKEELPGYVMLRQVIADNHIRRGQFEAALGQLDEAVVIEPNNPALYAVRLSVLGALGDGLAIEEQLKDNIERFSQDPSYKIALVRFYISQRQIDEAESFLRVQIAEDDLAIAPKLTLLQFLTELRGNLAALEELDLMIAQGHDDPAFLQLRSGVLFEMGQVDRAMADLEDLSERLGPSDDGRRIRVTLAKMRQAVGDLDGAQSLIDEVLATDSAYVEALKIKASWLISDDLTGEAIVALRTALEQSPRDAEIYTLLARAHSRDGNEELVGEMLALAVEASNKAPVETVRYARQLILDARFGPAESILLDALRLAPASPDILRELGYAYLGLREWGRLEQVIATLRNLGDERSQGLANEMQARFLAAQQRTDDALEFLAGLVRQGEAGFDANAAIVTAQLERGNAARAKSYLQEQLEQSPEDRGLIFLLAATETVLGNREAAEALYRSNIEADSAEIRSWLGLFRLLHESGREQAAREAADLGLAANPGSGTLLWIKASLLEKDGDITGAIDVYRGLYERDSDNPIIANNLASLLVEQSQDTETITQAYLIARRLRNADVPPYQDTYGWVAHLRGDHVEAVRALEPAARSLADDPVVQYHLAKAYLGLKDFGRAYEQFAVVVEMTGEDDQRPFAADARAEVARLATLPEVVGSQ